MTGARRWWWEELEVPAVRSAVVHVTEPEVRRLYGPSGEVLLEVSDRPPVGFHQGRRGG